MSKILSFTSLLTALVETLLRGIHVHEFLGVKLMCTFRGDDI